MSFEGQEAEWELNDLFRTLPPTKSADRNSRLRKVRWGPENRDKLKVCNRVSQAPQAQGTMSEINVNLGEPDRLQSVGSQRVGHD